MKYLFDTESLIALFNNEKGSGKVQFLLQEVDLGGAEGYISSVTLTELYYTYAKESEQKADEVIDNIRTSKLKLISVDEAIALRAGKYKKKPIPLADAIIGASAYEYKAHLITDDKHFKEVGLYIVNYR